MVLCVTSIQRCFIVCHNFSAWLSWAKRSRLEPFAKLAKNLGQRLDAVVLGMLDHRSNAYVQAMNGLLQQAKRAARGFKTAANFIAIAYLRMSKRKLLGCSTAAPDVKFHTKRHRAVMQTFLIVCASPIHEVLSKLLLNAIYCNTNYRITR